MKSIARKIINSSKKTPEVARFIAFLNHKGWNAKDLADSIDVAERTITNCLWNDKPLGRHLLQELRQVHGVSMDWVVTGEGAMFVNDSTIMEGRPEYKASLPLMKYHEVTDTDSMSDLWWILAKCTEQSMIEAGATPGDDYSMLDLYKLAQPFVLEKFKKNNIDITVSPD